MANPNVPVTVPDKEKIPYTRILVNRRCADCQNVFDSEALYHVHTPCYFKKYGIEKPPTDQPIGDTKPFVCKIGDCSETFATMNYLRRHVIYHFPKTWKCKVCEFEGFIKRDIERHTLIHTSKLLRIIRTKF